MSRIQEFFSEPLLIPLQDGEAVQYDLAVTRKSGAIKVQNVNLFVTNKRLLLQPNFKSASIDNIMQWGTGWLLRNPFMILSHKRHTRNQQQALNQGLEIGIADIAGLQPKRSKALFFIPATDNSLVIKDATGREETLILTDRQTAIDTINQAKAAAQPTGAGWHEIAIPQPSLENDVAKSVRTDI